VVSLTPSSARLTVTRSAPVSTSMTRNCVEPSTTAVAPSRAATTFALGSAWAMVAVPRSSLRHTVPSSSTPTTRPVRATL